MAIFSQLEWDLVIGLKVTSEKNFFKKITAINSLACTVDGISRSDDIDEHWKQPYYALFNLIQSEQTNIDAIDKNECLSLRANEVYQAIKKVPDNETCGVD